MDKEEPDITPEDKAPEMKPKRPTYTLQNFFRFFSITLRRWVSLSEGMDIDGTIESIHRDISFKGHTVWVLICSIFIASIGLNNNSIPVVVGAMLISPLMGPILGLGLSLGTNDYETLLRSLKNFGIMVGTSVAVATIYFLLTPFQDASSEILARTRPTFYDVLIAIFGGVAGIVAGTRYERGNVIPGVAIATALMPPLCTAGYGLAGGHWEMLLGAMYLFLINSVMICLATYIIVRYLRFPVVDFVDPKRERKIQFYIWGFVALLVIPSAFLFYTLVKETRFKSNATRFVNEVIKTNESFYASEFNYNDTVPVIRLVMMGEVIPDSTVNDWRRELKYYNVGKATLKVVQTKSVKEAESQLDVASDPRSQQKELQVYNELLKDREANMAYKDSVINALSLKLMLFENQKLPIDRIQQEMKQFYPLKTMRFANFLVPKKGGGEQMMPTFVVSWADTLKDENRDIVAKKLEQSLQLRTDFDTVRVVSIKGDDNFISWINKPIDMAGYRISQMTLAATNVESMVQFYKAVFEVEFKSVDAYGSTLFSGQFNDFTLLICPNDIAGVKAEQNRQQFDFLVDDLDKVLKIVKANGGSIFTEPIMQDGKKVASVKDPDGNTIVFVEEGGQN